MSSGSPILCVLVGAGIGVAIAHYTTPEAQRIQDPKLPGGPAHLRKLALAGAAGGLVGYVSCRSSWGPALVLLPP